MPVQYPNVPAKVVRSIQQELKRRPTFKKFFEALTSRERSRRFIPIDGFNLANKRQEGDEFSQDKIQEFFTMLARHEVGKIYYDQTTRKEQFFIYVASKEFVSFVLGQNEAELERLIEKDRPLPQPPGRLTVSMYDKISEVLSSKK